MRQRNQLPRRAPTCSGSYLSGAHVGQRIGQAARREDPGRHRLFQKRRERSARAVMVPKTPGEKPPGPTLSQAQAGAGSGRSPGVREIFGFCASSSWKKRSAKRSVEGEAAGSDQGYDLLQARPLRRSVRGSPAARRDSRRPLLEPQRLDGRRPSMGAGPGSAEVGPAPVWRAAPRARAETLRAAPETVSGTGQQHGGAAGGEWGVGGGGAGRTSRRWS